MIKIIDGKLYMNKEDYRDVSGISNAFSVIPSYCPRLLKEAINEGNVTIQLNNTDNEMDKLFDVFGLYWQGNYEVENGN